MALFGYIACVFMGLVLGLLGGGGSILTVPILVYLFKVPASLATGYSLFIVGATSLFAVYHYRKKQGLNLKIAFIFAIPSVGGVLISRLMILPRVPDYVNLFNFSLSKNQLILLVFSVLIVLISYFMFKSKDETNPTSIQYSSSSVLGYILISIEGFFVGIATGFIGAGGGFMIVPALVLLAKLKLRVAIVSSLLIISAKSLLGFLADVSAGIQFDYVLLISILILTFLGSFIGILISKNVPTLFLRKSFAVFVLVMGLIIFSQELNTIVAKPKNITATQFLFYQKQHPNLQLIDVRTPEEYKSGYIEGARLIPLNKLDILTNTIDPQKPIVLYCRSGRRSQQAQNMLTKKGFKHVLNLEGGILAYSKSQKKEETK